MDKIFQTNSDMEVRISHEHLEDFSSFIANVQAVLGTQAKSLYWFVYRPGRSNAIEHAVDIEAANGNLMSVTIHIETETIYPDIICHPHKTRESIELTVTNSLDAHHFVLRIASELGLTASKLINHGAVVFSSLG